MDNQLQIDQTRVTNLTNRIVSVNTGRDIKPFDLVYNNIYVGGNPNQDNPFSIHTGIFPKVDAVLNLRAESQISLNCKATLWMPIWDKPEFPGIDWLDTAVKYLESNNDRGWETYVHCNLGVSRSGMVMSAYVMKKENLKLEDAWFMLNEKRICWPNHGFLLGLCEYERYLKENK